MYNNNYSAQDSWQHMPDPTTLDMKVSAVMKQVYVKMFLALLVSAAAAVGVAFMAVSYTHLDVYKRQASTRRLPGMAGITADAHCIAHSEPCVRH